MDFMVECGEIHEWSSMADQRVQNDGITSFRAVDYGSDNSARVGVTRQRIDAFCA